MRGDRTSISFKNRKEENRKNIEFKEKRLELWKQYLSIFELISDKINLIKISNSISSIIKNEIRSLEREDLDEWCIASENEIVSFIELLENSAQELIKLKENIYTFLLPKVYIKKIKATSYSDYLNDVNNIELNQLMPDEIEILNLSEYIDESLYKFSAGFFHAESDSFCIYLLPKDLSSIHINDNDLYVLDLSEEYIDKLNKGF